MSVGDGPLRKVTRASYSALKTLPPVKALQETQEYLLGVGKQETLTTAELLAEEFQAIWGHKPRNYIEAAHERDQAALCLSGGGIRSAAFCLGVLQALAQKRLLSKFHYLSTVSGGGYVGGWLTRWIHDEHGDVGKVEQALGGKSTDAPAPDLPQIEALRKNSNYLTPKVGIASVDTWTAVMLWVRNTLLNLLIFIPLLMLVTVPPNLYVDLLGGLANCGVAPKENHLTCQLGGSFLAFGVCLAVGFVLIAFATYNASRFLPSHDIRRPGAGGNTGEIWRLRASEVTLRIVVPALSWAVLVPIAITINGSSSIAPLWIFGTVWAAKLAAYFLAWTMVEAAQDKKLFSGNFLTWICVSLLSSAVLGISIWLLMYLMPFAAERGAHPLRLLISLATIGPLLVTLSHLLMSALYVGYRRRVKPTPKDDDLDREWLGRISGMTVFPALLWAVLASVCVILPRMLFEHNEFIYSELKTVTQYVTFVLTPISGLFAVLGGKSAFSALDLVATPEQRQRFKIFDIAIDVATAIFVAILLMTLAWLEKTIVLDLPEAAAWLGGWITYIVHLIPIFATDTEASQAASSIIDNLNFVSSSIIGAHVVMLVAFGLLVLVSSNRIDVNRFSLHGIYRNRLIRAFLGGARINRHPEPFTHFDPHDNVRMCQLNGAVPGPSQAGREAPKRVLYPVINTTLNLVGGENLAWQERMASSFVITPIACGSAILDTREPHAPGTPKAGHAPARPLARKGAYSRSDAYGGNEHQGMTGAGISLGTAITISGAAKSPSEGYSSSPATAFLMTLFNVRLGAWLANPARRHKKDLEMSGPRHAVWPLISEMLGRTNEHGHYVYLTDGGHFDNLGLYEMIRRRCRFIIIVDADQDEDCKFDDLGRSVRQVFIDFDVDIQFDDISIQSRKSQVDKPIAPAFAFARIRYPEDVEPGWLIYLKPSYHIHGAPIDVRSYAEANAAFPHETTLDQWFSESQFESYRRLGYYLAGRIDESKKKTSKTKRTKKMVPVLPAGSVAAASYANLAAFFSKVADTKVAARQKTATD